jgi:hypothetical protein
MLRVNMSHTSDNSIQNSVLKRLHAWLWTLGEYLLMLVKINILISVDKQNTFLHVWGGIKAS